MKRLTNMKRIICSVAAALLLVTGLSDRLQGQAVTPGINYQAVARDNTGKELSDREIDVRFSVISGNPLGTIVYQELHQQVKTSRYGVFSLIIGSGVPVGGTAGELSSVEWGTASHFLKVEIKFLNEFSDMGTMQFMAVPYALYALQSLHAGPQGPQGPEGPQGPPGDPATDDQQLSFDGINLTISGGNTVNLSSLTRPAQDLLLTGDLLRITNNPEATNIDLSKYLDNTDEQALLWNPLSRELGITNSATVVDLSRNMQFNASDATLSINGGNSVALTRQLAWDDATSTLSINGGNSVSLTRQLAWDEASTTLSINGGNSIAMPRVLSYIPSTASLSINGGNTVSLSTQLSFNESTGVLYVQGGNDVNLSSLINDADSDPTNELITSVTMEGSELVIAEGSHVNRLDFSEHMIAFRAKRTVSESATQLTDVVFTPTEMEYNDGSGFNPSTGEFTAPATGIYTFNVSYSAEGSGGSRQIQILKNTELYEGIADELASGVKVLGRSVTMRLAAGDVVTMVISTGTATETGTGTFSGFRVW
jgi:hypothetical protein